MDPLDVIKSIPVTTKKEIRRNPDEFKSSNPEIWKGTWERSTGGSTGVPFIGYLSKKARSTQWGYMWRSWKAGGYEIGEKVGVIAGGTILPNFSWKRYLYWWLNNWITLDAYQMNKENSIKFIKRLVQNKIAYLYGHTTAIYSLSEYLDDIKNKPKIKSVFCTAEVLQPKIRELIEKNLNCKVFDIYGANDGGIIGFECENHDGMHIGMERCYLEVLRDDDTNANYGEVGRFICTDLDNEAFPLIRYENGDMGAVVRDRCKCGRGLLRIKPLIGRILDRVVTPDNIIVHGGVFGDIIKKHNWASRFQVIHSSKTMVEIRLDTTKKVNDSDIQKLKKEIYSILPGMDVNILLTDKFISTSGGKYRIIVPLKKEISTITC